MAIPGRLLRRRLGLRCGRLGQIAGHRPVFARNLLLTHFRHVD
jgi:hypothetical protein